MSSIESVKIVLLGNSGVGKTSIANKYVFDCFSSHIVSSICTTYLSKQVHYEPRNIRLQIWDTAGQEKYRSIAPIYYKDAHIILLIYDCTNIDSFEGIKFWHSQIMDTIRLPIMLAIVANKCDLLENEKVDYYSAISYAQSIGSKLYQTSALDGSGINTLFMDVCLSIRPKYITNSKKIDKIKKLSHGKCC